MSDLSAWPHLLLPGEKTAPVFVTLHGTGGNEQEITNLAKALDPTASILSPRGTVNEAGMLRWFRRLQEGVFDVDDVLARSAELASFVTWAVDHYGLTGRPLVAMGFSNGANMALALALTHPEVVNRVAAFSAMYPFGDRDPMVSLEGVEIYLASGEQDPMAPWASVQRLVEGVADHGGGLTHQVRPGGHGISADDVDQARIWLARVLPECSV